MPGWRNTEQHPRTWLTIDLVVIAITAALLALCFTGNLW